MRKWLKNSFRALLLTCPALMLAQDIPIGTWRTHFSYHQAHHLVSSPSKLFCATKYGFFSYDIVKKSVSILTKSRGLSDVGISALHYSMDDNLLFIGYQSGLIDIVSTSGIVTITDLKESSLEFDKEIKSIITDGPTVYASCGLGILSISLSSGEITDNFRSIGPGGEDLPTIELSATGGFLYALTEIGILKGELISNLLDFNNWEVIAGDTIPYSNLTGIGTSLYITSQNTILKYDGSFWQKVHTDSSDIIKMKSFEEEPWFSTQVGIFKLAGNMVIDQLLFTSLKNPVDFTVGESIWIADGTEGLFNSANEYIVPNGPKKDDFTSFRYLEKKIYGFYAPHPIAFDGSFDSAGYEIFDGTGWSNIQIEGFHNISDVARYQGSLYFSSIGNGVYSEISGILDETNSSLTKGNDGLHTVVPKLISGSGALSAIAFNHTFPLHQLGDDGNWMPFSASQVGSAYPIDLHHSESGILWITRSSQDGSGLSVFDTQNIQNKIINTSQGLPSNLINALSIDLNDEVWAGTQSGIVNFPFASLPFDGVEFFTPFFENEPLYEGQKVTSLQTDGGNRVWIATEGKLTVFNSSFSRMEHQFTVENSPLPSGTIKNLVYNSSNGEMFIYTDKGLVSYRSNSSFGVNAHRNVQVFPNPVRPGFSGEIGIKGVYNNAVIKITDISGKLVREIHANGGTASWDLRDYNGSKVDSGVYILLSNSADGADSYAGKLAVIR